MSLRIAKNATSETIKKQNNLYWDEFTRSETVSIADSYVKNWNKDISNKEFDLFAAWAINTGVFFPDSKETWYVFRGYCVGLKQQKQKLSRLKRSRR
jgi:hypothetical protein